MRGDLNLAVNQVIVPDEPADEADDDGGRHCRSPGGDDRVARVCLARNQEGREEKEDDAKRRVHLVEPRWKSLCRAARESRN
jgi:hypothetical protein